MFNKVLIANRGDIVRRRIRTAICFGIAVAASTFAKPDVAAADERLRAVQLDHAVDQFQSICLSTFPSKTAFDAAVRTSAWTFAQVPGSGGRHEWGASRGVATYIETGGSRAGAALPQCNLDFGIPTALEREAIAQVVDSHLKQALGFAPPRGLDAGFIFWEWPLKGGNVARLYLVQFKGADPRALTLTLQYWNSPRLKRPKNPDERGQ